jgi:hypothetical protein
MMYSPIQLVTDSVSSFNSLFLSALHQAACERPDRFPLAPELLDGFRQLTAVDCRERAAGIRLCLADAQFSDEAWWELAITAQASQRHPESDSWMGEIDHSPLTQSLLMVAWHGVRSLPSFSRVLFGMSPGVQNAFGKLNLYQLFGLARSPGQGIGPRWPDRTDIWSHVLNEHPDASRTLAVELRILQACARESSGMISRAALEFVQDLSLQTNTLADGADGQDSQPSSNRRSG